jgi:GDP-4-dehydro-6-deoxy-D-mannose reductase
VKRRALITGVSGFAGRHLARDLLAAGWEVAGTSLSRSSGVAGVVEQRLAIDHRQGLSKLVAGFEPDVVFHLAAIVDTVTTPDVARLFQTNVMGTVSVLEALREACSDARVVYASSAFAYGWAPPDAQPVREDQPLRPLTPYGASKAASEAIVSAAVRGQGVDAVVARVFQHTGPGHIGAYALSDWARQLAEIAAGSGSGVIKCGNIDVERDYLDVRDVSAAYRALALAGEAGEAYNVASGHPRSMRSLLEGLIAAFGVDVEIESEPRRVRSADQPVFYGDPAKVKRATDWEPDYELEETLADLAAFWLDRIKPASAEPAVSP